MTDRLQVLEDREAIKALAIRYAKYVAEGRGQDLIDDVFTDDVVMDFTGTGGQVIKGKGSLTFFLGLKPAEAIPLVHNHLIEVDGDEATGFCVMESRLSKGEPPGFITHFTDRYRRDGGRWRFAERKVAFYIPPPAPRATS